MGFMRWTCVALLAVACAHARVDLEASRASLIQADADFNADVAKRGLDAWVDAFAEDGAMFVTGAPVIRGHDKIREAMEELGDPREGPGKLTIRWRPLGAQVSSDGSMGYTWGNGIINSPRGESKTKYVTVWRNMGGRWKAVADIGNTGYADFEISP
jgi:ketosteroid isomerase-like protein